MVTATDTSGSASETSNALGPITLAAPAASTPVPSVTDKTSAGTFRSTDSI